MKLDMKNNREKCAKKELCKYNKICCKLLDRSKEKMYYNEQLVLALDLSKIMC